MRPLYKALLVGLVHLLLISSLGAKLLYDRNTRPRVWVRAAPYDPSMPIRGRYVRLQLRVETRGFDEPDASWRGDSAALKVEDEKLIAEPSKTDTGVRVRFAQRGINTWVAAPRKIGIQSFQPPRENYRDHLKIEGGVVLQVLDEKGAAATAGLRKGDIILRVDGNPVENYNDFESAIRIATPAETSHDIIFTVMRGHDTFTVTVPWRPAPGLEDDSSQQVGVLAPWTPFFIPEHIDDPSRRDADEELWVEVTIPKKGPPRPIRLGVKKGDGDIVPLDID